jgi:hypothetical protein
MATVPVAMFWAKADAAESIAMAKAHGAINLCMRSENYTW